MLGMTNHVNQVHIRHHLTPWTKDNLLVTFTFQVMMHLLEESNYGHSSFEEKLVLKVRRTKDLNP